MNYFTANRTSDKCQFQTKLAYRFNVLVREMGRIPFVALLSIRLEGNGFEQTIFLTRITSEIYDAGISANKTVIEKYSADTYLETDAMGILRDKAWNIANPLTANEKLTYKIEESEVREYDNVAVLYYKWIVHYELKISK